MQPLKDVFIVTRALFAEVLTKPVEPTDNFFACGGDSLRATQLSIELEDAFGVVLEARDIVEAPTPHQLALVILERRAALDADDPELAQAIETLSEVDAERLMEALGR